MMKKLFLTVICCCGVWAINAPLQAVQTASNGAEAKSLVKEDGYVIFIYADGWDEYSRKACQDLMADAEVRKAAGDAVLMPLPYPENPNEERKKKQKELLGGLDVPTPHSFPALILLDKQGRHYATIKGRAVARAKASEVAALLSDRMQKGRERLRLIAESEKATDGAKKARLLFDAYQLEGLSWAGKGFGDRLAKLDPQDSSGVRRSLNFNPYGFTGGLDKKGLKNGLAEVEKMLADPAYTPQQKQRICAAAIGLLRRQGGMNDAQTMRDYIKRMKEYAPHTPEGQAADLLMREWIPGLHYGRGWNPSCIPPTKQGIEMDGKLPIKEAGTYVVRFNYGSGSAGLSVFAVTLYDGEKKVAEDGHTGFAGNMSKDNVFRLTAPKSVSNPRLIITLGQDNRDSYGKITIEKE